MNRTLLAVLSVGFTLAIAIVSCEQASLVSDEVTGIADTRMSLAKTIDTTFTGHEDHSISTDDANAMTTTFQNSNPFDTYAWYFGKDAIEHLIAQTGAVGIRIYGGIRPNGQFSPVIYGVDANANDIKPTGLSKTVWDSDSTSTAEAAILCPPFCGTPP